MPPHPLARLSLLGLSVGDALGEARFKHSGEGLPPEPWPWSDDTAMSIALVSILEHYGQVNQDALAKALTKRYQLEPDRGYGPGAKKYLAKISEHIEKPDFSAIWRSEVKQMFNGEGSYGNGSAMRVAPLGVFFKHDLNKVKQQAALSAEVTHAHPEGTAGAIAVAIAAAMLTKWAANDFLETVISHTPDSLTKAGLEKAMKLSFDSPLNEAAELLGTGKKVSCQDTVPFCLWLCARNIKDYKFNASAYRSAVKEAINQKGDRDTMGAIVGGIMAMTNTMIPTAWQEFTEPVPEHVRL